MPRKPSFKGLSGARLGAEKLDTVSKGRAAPPSEVVSTIWHFGWGAEDMKAAYQKQLDSGTKFATPITDISDIGGGPPNYRTIFLRLRARPGQRADRVEYRGESPLRPYPSVKRRPSGRGRVVRETVWRKARSSPQVHMYGTCRSHRRHRS